MKRVILFVAFVIFAVIPAAQAQDAKINFNEKIKNNPAVVTGKLKNGLTYYILKNSKPEKRAELRLAVNAGSILEDDDQRGLAHFVEHMAFNGTKNFKKQEIVNFLETIGMRFGPELNAYTSFDETVYMIQIPTEKKDILQKGFKILSDWASSISFENEEIDKERGVIIEEWRLGRGAQGRILDKMLPVVLKDSKYAERYVIGKKEILESFKYETLKRFYKDWYRPELMAVIAVGDFNVKEIEDVIKKEFGSIPAAKNPRKRSEFDVPCFKETLYSIESDIELPMANTTVYYKNKPYSTLTNKDFKEDAMGAIFSGIMGDRLQEISLKADAPFLGAQISSGTGFVRAVQPAVAAFAPKDNNIEKGLKAVLVELEKAKKFGFTETELERQKKEYLRGLEENVKEKDKRESAEIIERIIENFLKGESYPNEETNFELGNKIVPTITLKDLNEFVNRVFVNENRVVTVSLPEKSDVKKPSKEALAAIIDNIGNEKIEAYVDKTLNEDLIPFEIKLGRIVSEKKEDKTNTTELVLSNGAKVVLKPTDFKNDEILYSSFSFGGSSLADDKDEVTCSIIGAILGQSGVGKFNQTQLGKYLTGKVASVSSYIGTYWEGVSGRSSVKDLETMFKLNYLYFTQPRKDSAVFKSLMSIVENTLKNRSSNPDAVFSDSLGVTLYNYHKRKLPVTVERLKEINLDRGIEFYKERFADAGDFTFVFVGSFDIAAIKPLIEKYIGGLPSIKRNEKWKDINLTYAKGNIQKTIKKGIEPKSKVQMYFTGNTEWTKGEVFRLNALVEAMNIKLREAIREEKGGTYGIGISPGIARIPNDNYSIVIGWGCQPQRAEELSNQVMVQIDSVVNYPMKEQYINKVKETELKSREKGLKENNTWLSWIQNAYMYNQPVDDILNYKEKIDSLTPKVLQETAKKYFNKDNFIKLTLYPEK